jgi:Tfp pilus assembly protein FimT
MRKPEAGFTVIEVTVVAAVAMATVGLAAPSIIEAIDAYKFNSDVQQVAATIRGARYNAVASNTTLRVRFNCPATGQMRVLEVTGNSAIDNASDRCDTTSYPYPDGNGSAAPNNDGPVIQIGPSTALPTTVSGLEISTAGRVVPIAGCPACAASSPPATLTLGDDYTSTNRTITVTATGGTRVARFSSARSEQQAH